MNQLSKDLIDTIIVALRKEMEECEAMIPLAMEAAIESGIKLRGVEYIYNWLSGITDHLALLAAQERNKRTSSTMKTFVPKG